MAGLGCAGARPTLEADTALPAATVTARPSPVVSTPVALNPALEAAFVRWEQEGPSGDEAHRERLKKLADAVDKQLRERGKVDLVFVCTHNSRRSHMTQLLALAAAQRLGVAGVRTFSGGTEATAFNPRAIAALSRLGFELSSGEGKNPKVTVRFSPVAEPVEAFSKKYTDPPNPEKDFVVVMTCSQADGSCPFVVGALSRVAIPYEDPKVADGTPEEAARYDERASQIGRDMAWVFRQGR